MKRTALFALALMLVAAAITAVPSGAESGHGSGTAESSKAKKRPKKSGSIILYEERIVLPENDHVPIIKSIDAHGNYPRAVVKVGRNPGAPWHMGGATFAPRGRLVAFHGEPRRGTDCGGLVICTDIFLIGTFNKRQRPLNITNTEGAAETSPAYGADGLIAFAVAHNGSVSSTTIEAVRQDGTGRRKIYEFQPPPGARDSYHELHSLSFDPNGKRIVFAQWGWYSTLPRECDIPICPDEAMHAGSDSRLGDLGDVEFGGIYAVNRDGSGLEQLTNDVHAYMDIEGCPRYTSDGKSIMYSKLGETRIMDADGSNDRRFMAAPSHVCPIPSPKGERIAFSRFLGDRRPYTTQVFIRNIFDLKERRLTGGKFLKSPTDWTLINPAKPFG